MASPTREHRASLGSFSKRAGWRPPPHVSFAAFAIFVCMLATGTCILDLQHARNVAVAVARHEAENLTQSLAQQVSDTLEAADGALLTVADYAQNDRKDRASRTRLRATLAALVATMPRIHNLIITDERGAFVVSNFAATSTGEPGVTDRPYFRYHRSHPGSRVYISGPAVSKSDHSWVFFATRRIDHANGSFAGVAIAPISLDYFDRSFGEVDVGPSGFIALMAGNGTILARRPRAFIAQRLLRAKMFSAPYDSSVAASYIEPSPDDGVRRLLAFHRLDRYPLVISVALAESDYLAAWRADSLANYLALAAGTALIGGLASALGTQIFKRKQTEEILARLPPFDVLTGMAHRRRFEEELEREWRRAARDRVPLGLLVIEIENLNAFNDSYGHEVGDDLLIAIAHSISANIVRPADVAARYSGLEFAVILPTTNEAGALLVSERIRRALLALIAERKAMPNATVVVHVGAASTIPKTAESASTLVHAAVLAVRSAKSKR